ncbi:MAG: hypothetical protein HFE52_02560 [Clostridia bacterium]|nr:hypothetical protein [Clostridia bacterium]MCI8979531.1 hypothetical protein [Clostridia bacterium]
MSENKTNMEELLQDGIDLGDTEAVGTADDPFADISVNDDPFAGLDSAEDTFTDIEDDNNPFANAVTEEISVKETETAKVTETGASEEAPEEQKTAKESETAEVKEIKQDEKAVDNNASVQDKQEVSDAGGEQESSNPFEAEIDRVETQAAEETKAGLLNKPPVFKFAAVKEDIIDLSQTFDNIRVAKAKDFPELEDVNRVTWSMNYCGVVKKIAKPKEMTIGEQKKLIEESKEFITAIKRKKGDFDCEVIPTVIAQKKGQMEAYKGVFLDEETAVNSGKAISYVPSEAGDIYEIRRNAIGTFRAKTKQIRGLTKIKAGFTPALPRIPFTMLSEIISFFRHFAVRKHTCEALVNLYWDTDTERYVINVPKQIVGQESVETTLPEVPDNLLHVMDIHSHNYMKAKFSKTDDEDEKATRLYTVIGRLDKLFPDISTRISVGGIFENINSAEIFEYPFDNFPNEWLDSVKERRAGGAIQ